MLDQRPWADPSTVAINRLAMHVPMPSGPDARKLLDGRWQFRLLDSPEAVTNGDVCGPTPRDWRTITVPGSWTMQATGDLPHYTNIDMPFPGPPPSLPAHNPTGVYRTSFTAGRGWRSQQVVLHVGGAESAHLVYLNDRFVGYGTDSKLAAEYDVTDHLVTGANHLAVVVVRYSAQSYVEDQDQWWMAGLHRSVWVEARGPVHLADVRCTADLADTDGVLDLDVHVGFSRGPRQGFTVRTRLVGPDGREVAPHEDRRVPATTDRPYVFTGHRVRRRVLVPGVLAWSAECPNRYRVEVELCGPAGVVDATHQYVGFRRVEVVDRELRVNGARVWIFGVNRHDHHPERGPAVTTADLRADLVAMRRHNITAVRTSHYPNDPAFYDLCDELGMYVVDEANIESHAYNTSLCDDTAWSATWLARGSRMVQRDRNHPCVILWSLGNESGYGANHDALAGWTRRADPTRPLHYEGAVFHDGWVDGGRAASDIVCPMYPPLDSICEYGTAGLGDRPLVMCEYSHAMGNSNGSLADYWDVITATPGVQGGFIWEWADHGLRLDLATGGSDRRLAVGGMFGDEPHDGNFVADGLVASDGTPHPAMHEVAWVYRPVTVTAGRTRGRLRVTNRRSFTGLDDLRAVWTLRRDGVAVDTGEWAVPQIGAHAVVDVVAPCTVPAGRDDVRLDVVWSLREERPWAPVGHVVAWDQIILREGRSRPPVAAGPATGAAPVVEPELCLARAPVDNDGFKLLADLTERVGVGSLAYVRWTAAGLYDRPADSLVDHRVVRRDGSVWVEFRHEVVVPDELTDLPRVGVSFGLPGHYESMRWFGRGPGENYPDRASGSMLAVWEAPIDVSPYLVPQEFGLRTECRWMELLGGDGHGVRVDVIAPRVLHMSATRHSVHDLLVAANEADLTRDRGLVVHLDVAHRGVGTASCGPDVADRYRLGSGAYRFAYRVSAIASRA